MSSFVCLHYNSSKSAVGASNFPSPASMNSLMLSVNLLLAERDQTKENKQSTFPKDATTQSP